LLTEIGNAAMDCILAGNSARPECDEELIVSHQRARTFGKIAKHSHGEVLKGGDLPVPLDLIQGGTHDPVAQPEIHCRRDRDFAVRNLAP
jgi:hypothetical protein